MIGVLGTQNNLGVRNARQPVKRKDHAFACLGQGHKQTQTHKKTNRNEQS